MKALVAQACDLLASAEYKYLPQPMAITGISFEFETVLLAPHGSWSLVIPADELTDPRRFVQKIEALAQALDLGGSHRSITVILDASSPLDIDVVRLTSSARVLPLSAQSQVSNEINSLLPLTLPAASSYDHNPLEAALSGVSEKAREILESSGITAVAPKGSESVVDTFTRWIVEPIMNGE